MQLLDNKVLHGGIIAGLYTFVVSCIALWDQLFLAGSWIKIVVLVAVGSGIAWVVEKKKHKTSETEDTEYSKQEYDRVMQMHEEFEAVILRIADLSSKQIETSRGQTEEAIVTLSKRFRNLVEQINLALAGSRARTQKFENEHQNLDLLSIFDDSREKLDEVVKNRKQARDDLLSRVQQLAKQISALRNHTDEIQTISSRTGLLALNASIEASRAGKNGRSFTVVANEVRNLSQRTTETVKRITDAVDDISESMSETVINAISVSEQDTAKEFEAHETISNVLKDIHDLTEGLSESSDQLRDESVSIRNEISDILVALQFQDRTSQILSHVCNSFGMFIGEVETARQKREAGEIKVIDAHDILSELRKGYTTSEQHRIHVGQEAGKVNSEDIEYF